MVAGEKGWEISIRNPCGDSNFTIVRLKDQALATSGAGVQFFNHKGSRFGYIIDPRSGMPAKHFLRTTAIADNAVSADALSTAFFVMEIQEVQAFCENNPDAGALLVTGHESEGEADYHVFGRAEVSAEIILLNWEVRQCIMKQRL